MSSYGRRGPHQTTAVANSERKNEEERRVQEELGFPERKRGLVTSFRNRVVSSQALTAPIHLLRPHLPHILTVLLPVSGCTGTPRSSFTTHLHFNCRSKYSDISPVANRESKPQRLTVGMHKPISHFRKPRRNILVTKKLPVMFQT